MENLLLDLALEPTKTLAGGTRLRAGTNAVLQKCDCQGLGTIAIANRRTQIKTSVTALACQQ